MFCKNQVIHKNLVRTIGYDTRSDIVIPENITNVQDYLQQGVDFVSSNGGGGLFLKRGPQDYVCDGVVDLKSNIEIFSDGAKIKQKPDWVIGNDGLLRTELTTQINNIELEGIHFEGTGQKSICLSCSIISIDTINNIVELGMRESAVVSTGGSGATTIVLDRDYFFEDDLGNDDTVYSRKLYNTTKNESVIITSVTNLTTATVEALPSDWGGDTVKVSLNLGQFSLIRGGDSNILLGQNLYNTTRGNNFEILDINNEEIEVANITSWVVGDSVTQQTLLLQRAFQINAKNIKITNCEFTGYQYNQCGMIVGVTTKPETVILENNLIHGCSGFGVTDGCDNIIIKDNISDDWNYDYVYLASGNYGTNSNVQITNNQVTKGNKKLDNRMHVTGGGGIDVNSNSVIITNNNIANPITSGIYFHSSYNPPLDTLYNINISNNIIEDKVATGGRLPSNNSIEVTYGPYYGTGYLFDVIQNVKIDNNIVDGRIVCKGVKQGSVTNNTIEYIGFKEDAVLLTNCDEVDVIGNYATGFTNFLNLYSDSLQLACHTVRWGRNILKDVTNTITGSASTLINLDATTNVYEVTVGLVGSGAKYECNGSNDNTQIQTAVNEVVANGGGIVQVNRGNYQNIKLLLPSGSPATGLNPLNVTIKGKGENITTFTSSEDYILKGDYIEKFKIEGIKTYQTDANKWNIILNTTKHTKIDVLGVGGIVGIRQHKGIEYHNKSRVESTKRSGQLYSGSFRYLPTLSPTGTGVLDGIYKYRIVFESIHGFDYPNSTATDGGVSASPVNQQVQINVPLAHTYVNNEIIARHIYRTTVGTDNYHLLTTISDNTTTTYTDNTPDVNLGGAYATYSTYNKCWYQFGYLNEPAVIGGEYEDGTGIIVSNAIDWVNIVDPHISAVGKKDGGGVQTGHAFVDIDTTGGYITLDDPNFQDLNAFSEIYKTSTNYALTGQMTARLKIKAGMSAGGSYYGIFAENSYHLEIDTHQTYQTEKEGIYCENIEQLKITSPTINYPSYLNNNTYNGIYLENIKEMTLSAPEVIGPYHQNAIYIKDSTAPLVFSVISRYSQEHGIVFDNSDWGEITGGYIANSSYLANATFSDILLLDSNYNTITSIKGRCAGTNKAKYMVEEQGTSDYNNINNCIGSGHVSGKISLTGANSNQSNNI